MLLRVWKELDIKDIEHHLLVIGDMFGDCGHCKELGLEWKTVRTCPRCQTPFKYITLRVMTEHGLEKGYQISKIAQLRTDLTFIDYNDYKKTNAKDKAHRFFDND
jgi:hypothetical protein